MSVMKAYRLGFGAAPRNESFMKLRSHGRFRMFFVLHWSIDCCSAKRVLKGTLLGTGQKVQGGGGWAGAEEGWVTMFSALPMGWVMLF